MPGLKILLDTHIALWAITDDGRLSEAARKFLISEENEIYYSTASVWEVQIKRSLHPENMPVPAGLFSKYCRYSGYIMLPVRDSHVFALETLSRPENAPKHKDPFDRILVAQAKAEGMLFLTHDQLIPYYDESFIIPV